MFAGAAAVALALGAQAQGRDHAGHGEGLFVRRAADFFYIVLRQAPCAGLAAILCKAVLGSLPTACICGVMSTSANSCVYDLLGHGKTGLQVHRAQDGLDRIGQDGGTALAARARFALAQAQQLGQAQAQGQLVEAAFLTRLARARERSPSGESASLWYSQLEMARPSTESPKNSRRSLWCG